MKIGILALQGGYDLHKQKIEELSLPAVLIKKQSELKDITALIIPGGESTTLLKLCDKNFRDEITARAKSGMPILATCAGTILIAKKVSNPEQESLGLIDIDLERNAYGRQVDSFITTDLEKSGTLKDEQLEAVFIRAPRISRVGKGVEVLLNLEKDPVLVKEGNIMAATFHPELGRGAAVVHRYFVSSLTSKRPGMTTEKRP